MYNDLIKKNAELGRFLFCERYTLQPVKNSLYIAEGQDLKRGAVVDVNGVLVGTNSLMPYAVLENDCDTRAKGAFASVFVKGEFNFDKLFFADGLSKNDLDNIVYNGSGIGLVIKPYNYEKGFTPSMVPAGTSEENPIMNAEDVERMILEMLPLRPNTLRFKFSKKDYNPETAGAGEEGIWTKVNSAFSNIWDWTKNDTDFSGVFNYDFRDEDNLVSIIAAGDTSSVTDMSHMFESNTSLVSVPLFNTSSVTNMEKMFAWTPLTSIPLFNTSSVTNMKGMFEGCHSLKSVPLFNTSSVTSMDGMFFECDSLVSIPLFNTSSVTNMNGMFEDCPSLKSVPLFNTSSVTEMGYMFINCRNVEAGSLALYQQASTQENPPLEHSSVFENCGIDTATGASELAQIPASWGGLAEG